MGDENKIYVGGLAVETTSETLRAHFAQFGEITDCIVMPDKVTGRSRCFGFVSYKDISAVNAALGTSNVVDGREVSCKKAVRENPASIVQGGDGVYNSVKIFVGGLPATCDYEKFTTYFGRFGQIEDAVVMMDNQTQRHRGFGYVTYSEGSAVEAALQNYAANQIDGKWIEVKRCIPQDKMAPGQSFKGKGKGAAKGADGKGRAPLGYPAAQYTAETAAAAFAANPYGAYGAAGYSMPQQLAGVAYAQQPLAGLPQTAGGTAYASAAATSGAAYGVYGAAPAGTDAYSAAAGSAYSQALAGGYNAAMLGNAYAAAVGGMLAQQSRYGTYRPSPY